MRARHCFFVSLLLVTLTAVAHFTVDAQMVWNHAAQFLDSAYIAIPHSSSLNITSSLTVEAWVNTTSTGVVTVVGDDEFRLLIDAGRGRIQVNNNTRLESKSRVNDGKWNHIACVLDNGGKTITFYVNGAFDTSGSLSTVPSTGTDSITIGRSIYGSAPAMLDEIRIWNAALSGFSINAEQHTSLAVGTGVYANLVLSMTFQSLNNTDFSLDVKDKSGNANNGVNRRATAVDMSNAPTIYLVPNESLYFDGLSGYAEAGKDPNLPALGPFTIEAWIYPVNSATGKQQTIISRETSGFVGYEMLLTSTGKLALITTNTIGSSAATIPSGQWTHVAVTYTYDGTFATTQLFINGVRDGFYNASPISDVADSVCIGRSAGNTNYFNGYIDEVRFSGYVKTVGDIRKGMFTSIDNNNRRTSSDLELVYGLDGSVNPTTYASPVLTLRGTGAMFAPLHSLNQFPVSPLTRDPASPGSFPDGYYLKSSAKRIPASGTNAGSIEDTLEVSESVSINNLKIFAGFNHFNESALQLTLFSPDGDSLTFWNLDFQSVYTNGVAAIFDDAADSAMSHTDLSFTPTVRPHTPINAVFAGKNSAGAWRLRASQLISGFSGFLYGWGIEFNNQTLVNVAQTPTAAPARYTLFQAYPNPFNPTTVIRYQVPSASHVALLVFNSIGQRVATLVDGEISEGEHQVTFDGSRLSSGVYFYRMTAGTFVQTRKVVLVK